jgi:hypothetical protein
MGIKEDLSFRTGLLLMSTRIPHLYPKPIRCKCNVKIRKKRAFFTKRGNFFRIPNGQAEQSFFPSVRAGYHDKYLAQENSKIAVSKTDGKL